MASRCIPLLLLLLSTTSLLPVHADNDSNDEAASDFARGRDGFPDFADCAQEAPAEKYTGVIYGIGRYARGVDTVGTYPGSKTATNQAFVDLVDAYVDVFAEGAINITLAGTIYTNKPDIRASTLSRATGFYVRRHAFTAHQMWQCPAGGVLVTFSGTILNGAVTASTGAKRTPQVQLQKYTQLWVKQGNLWKVKYSLPVDEFPTSRGTITWNSVLL